jgi:hypothetical protein
MVSVDPRPSLASRVVGLSLGAVFAPVFGLASFVRRKRSVHPYGGGYAVSITVTDPLPSLTGTALGRVDRLDGIVRLSHGLGRSAGRPDVRGFALRILDHGGVFKQDIVMMSTSTRSGRQAMTMPTAYTTRYSSVLPLVAPLGPVVFTCLPMESGAVDQYFDRGHATGFRFQLSAGRPHEAWYPCADIVFERALTSEECEQLRFNPFNADLGLRPISTISMIRRVVYPVSQLGRGAWSDRPAGAPQRELRESVVPSTYDQASAARAARPGSR